MHDRWGHNSYERKRVVLTFTRLVCRASIGGINPKVRDLGRSDAGGVVRVGTHQKMGEESPERKFRFK